MRRKVRADQASRANLAAAGNSHRILKLRRALSRRCRARRSVKVVASHMCKAARNRRGAEVRSRSARDARVLWRAAVELAPELSL